MKNCLKSAGKCWKRAFGKALLVIAAIVLMGGGPAIKGAEVQLLVKCEGGPLGEKARAADTAAGAKVLRRFEALGWHLVRLPEGVSAGQGMARYRAQPGVLKVELNHPVLRRPEPVPPVVEPAPEDEPVLLSLATTPQRVVPNDPRYGSQWNLKKIGMETAWGITTGSTNVVVAVIDTGVDYTHPDLAANMWRNPGETGLDAQGRDKATNGLDDDGNGYSDDVHGISVVHNTGDPMDLGYISPPRTDDSFLSRYRRRGGHRRGRKQWHWPVWHQLECPDDGHRRELRGSLSSQRPRRKIRWLLSRRV